MSDRQGYSAQNAVKRHRSVPQGRDCRGTQKTFYAVLEFREYPIRSEEVHTKAQRDKQNEDSDAGNETEADDVRIGSPRGELVQHQEHVHRSNQE